MAIFKGSHLFQTTILGIHVSFRRCRCRVEARQTPLTPRPRNRKCTWMSEVTEIAHGALVAQGLSSTQGKGFKLTQSKHEIQHPNPEGLICFQKISPATENYTGRFWPLRALSLNQNIHGLQESGCSRLPKDARSPQVETKASPRTTSRVPYSVTSERP